jgi:hypothetical protein
MCMTGVSWAQQAMLALCKQDKGSLRDGLHSAKNDKSAVSSASLRRRPLATPMNM